MAQAYCCKSQLNILVKDVTNTTRTHASVGLTETNLSESKRKTDTLVGTRISSQYKHAVGKTN